MQNKETAKTVSAPKQTGPLLYIVITLLLTVILVVAGFWLYKNVTKIDYVQATIKGQAYKLEVANSESEREKGLSERDSLQANHGMLFDFQQDGDWRIWMLQMRFPIDIVWLNADKKVVAVKADATPGSYPEVFHADQQNRYVIELNAGDVYRLGLQAGDTVQW